MFDCVKVKLSGDLDCTILGWEVQDVANPINGDPLLIEYPPSLEFSNSLLSIFLTCPDSVARSIKVSAVESGTVTPGTGVQIPFRA